MNAEQTRARIAQLENENAALQAQVSAIGPGSVSVELKRPCPIESIEEPCGCVIAKVWMPKGMTLAFLAQALSSGLAGERHEEPETGARPVTTAGAVPRGTEDCELDD